MILSAHQNSTGTSLRYPIINGLMFNLAWLAIVTTASPVLAPAVVALHLLLHFAIMGKGWLELSVIAQATLFGVLLDQLLFNVGIFTIDGKASLPPLWMTCIWPVFATTLMHAFSTLQHRYFIASIAGGIGGAASFIAGTRLTDVSFGSELYGPVIIAVLWALLFPLLLQLPRVNQHYRNQTHD